MHKVFESKQISDDSDSTPTSSPEKGNWAGQLKTQMKTANGGSSPVRVAPATQPERVVPGQNPVDPEIEVNGKLDMPSTNTSTMCP